DRVVAEGLTVSKRVSDSRVPLAVTGVAMRRALRPGGRLIRSLPPADIAAVRAGSIVEGLNNGQLTVAQPAAIPAGGATVAGVAGALVPNLPAWLLDLLRNKPKSLWWLLLILLLLALILFLLGVWVPIAVTFALLAVGLFLWLRRQAANIAAADAMRPENEAPATVAELAADPTFAIEPFGVVNPTAGAGTTDSPEAVRFKGALASLFELHREVAVANPSVVRPRLDLGAIAVSTITTINPARSISLRYYRTVSIPGRIKDGMRETFIEAMAYPRIDEAMYRPLADIGKELLLPNIGLIPADSITLLETNQKFIESYMVGLNHEFARELLWREYPTDQRGSYFRQFWDVSGYQDVEGLSADALREKLYDIPKLHLWSSASELGAHDNRQPPGSPPKDEVVLSIRGELLKRYPTAVIYAHKADWQRPAGIIDKSLIRLPVPLTEAEEANPPRNKVKTPLYEAKVDPDITFFGFDLTAREAKGDPATDDAGWFFVIKERPGEPRFGLDIDRGGAPINSWSDLAWGDVTTENGLLRINAAMHEHQLTTAPPTSEGQQEIDQHDEDRQLRWDRNTNAADVAYVLYQLPVLVAVHGAEMLPH
ncbi:MAG TPA: hypothetical protein VNG71_02550, partial [Pyrinomonadaceae bacterium]|nr:hypothetical protein [Pyrinomonadaceae bacterium]